MLWEIPRCNIYSTIASDPLHQLKKGVWVHLIDWFECLIFNIYDVRQANRYMHEFNKRFRMVPSFSGIKSFPNGISELSYITAKETADIMKVFLFYFILFLFYNNAPNQFCINHRYFYHALEDFLWMIKDGKV